MKHDRPMVFAEPQPLTGPVVVTVPHDYGGDTNDLRDSLRSAGVTCEVIRAAPPPQHDEHRVTLTSKHVTTTAQLARIDDMLSEAGILGEPNDTTVARVERMILDANTESARTMNAEDCVEHATSLLNRVVASWDEDDSGRIGETLIDECRAYLVWEPDPWKGPIDADKVAAGCFVLVGGKIGVRAAEKVAGKVAVVMLGTGQIETLRGDAQVLWRDA